MTHVFRRTLAMAISIALLSSSWPIAAADADSSNSRASLDNMVVSPDQVQILLNKPAKYNTFTTANPPRVILEVLGASINVSPRIMAGEGSVLKRVRAGQFQGEPEPVCRVVLDLKELVRYTVTPDSNRIVVKLESAPATAAAKAPVASAVTPPPSHPAPPVAQKTVAPSQPSAPTPPPLSSIPEVTSPATERLYTSKEMEKPMAEKELTANAAQNSLYDRATVPAAIPAAYVPQTPLSSVIAVRAPVHDIIGNLPRDTVSLDLQDTDIGDVLKLLAAKANTNIIYGPDVTGSITLHLNKVPFNEAFNVVLAMKGLAVFQAGDNTLRVVTAKQLQLERTNSVGVTQVFRVYYQDAADIKKELDSVRSAEKRQGQTTLDVKNNEIIVTDTPDGLASAERLISQLDVRPQQVLIETKLVEVNLNKSFNLGIQWAYFSQDQAQLFGQQGTNFIGGNPTISGGVAKPLDAGGSKITVPSPAPIGPAGPGTGVSLAAPTSFGAFSFGRVTNNYILNATLTAAASNGKAKVLSDPKIATINGKQATINITTQVPFATTNTSATGAQSTTISYTTTGIQLTVTPFVNADGRITLHLVPNVSKPSATIATGAGAQAGAISLDTRTSDTNIIVRDGETIVIGGIITDSVSDSESKIPFFGDIPLLGWLFKNKSTSRTRVELLIFVTTKLIPD